ncbi:hypothetical protein NPIL_430201 [Nephila pilipes]|uniref:Uncharacterized protein n=1 Tax=Nephila pilipes TaxID=299642 RepID=A0A8X6MIA8_NEPPI|nr:hypothetical protein NPIL_430201 [Nephila pilipes]
MCSPNSFQPAPEKEIARSKCPNDLVHCKVGQLYHKTSKEKANAFTEDGKVCQTRNIRRRYLNLRRTAFINSTCVHSYSPVWQASREEKNHVLNSKDVQFLFGASELRVSLTRKASCSSIVTGLRIRFDVPVLVYRSM